MDLGSGTGTGFSGDRIPPGMDPADDLDHPAPGTTVRHPWEYWVQVIGGYSARSMEKAPGLELPGTGLVIEHVGSETPGEEE